MDTTPITGTAVPALPLPPDHRDRRALAGEVHARPPEAIATPSRASLIALLVNQQERARELDHVGQLCAQAGAAPPTREAIHFTADLGTVRLKWERHGEFSSYTFFADGIGTAPFAEPAIAALPAAWVAAIPGATIFAGHAAVIEAPPEPLSATALAAYFEGTSIVGARVSGGDALAYTDFKIQADGFTRFLVCNRNLTPSQAGRTTQRLFEIETYRMMALLALPFAREQSKQLSAIEAALAALTADIARQNADDEGILQKLSQLAVDVESRLAAGQFRFGACKAYSDLVTRRISELREERLPGLQTIEDFMTRRFTPAVATCASTEQRLHALSERVAQTSALLSTRVEIARQAQNQMLLGSMNRRARLQLRLQQTVEIISVIPITYYLTGLVGYISKALESAGMHVHPELIEGIFIPIVAVAVILGMRRAHHALLGEDRKAGGE